MKFLISNNDGTQELLCINKKKNRIRLKHGNGYCQNYIGKVVCELQETDSNVDISIEGIEFTLDFAQADYLRKVLNAYHEHISSQWLSEEERKESIYKLKE